MNVGWAAKMINVYLKTTCYLSGFGREGLECVIHPPIDNILMKNLKGESWESPLIKCYLDQFESIGRIDGKVYLDIIKAFKLIARERHLKLIELEVFFTP